MAQDTKGALPIPPEVLGDIAAHSAVELAESLHTLKQCCLVNNTFRDHFQPHIYRFLDIEDDADSKRKWAGPETTAKVLEAIERNPKLAAYVKEIWLSLAEDIIAEDPRLSTLLLLLHEVSSLRSCYHEPLNVRSEDGGCEDRSPGPVEYGDEVPELVALWTDEEAEVTPWEPKYGLVTNGGGGVGGGGDCIFNCK